MQPLVLGKPGESLSLSAISREMNDLSTEKYLMGTAWSLNISHSSK